MTTQTEIEVVMPQMGVSVSEGTIIKWLKREGETVLIDEPLLEISTDKIDTEVPAPASGVLGRITRLEGETVAVGTTIALIEGVDQSTIREAVTKSVAAARAEPAAPADPRDRTFVSPVVARIAAEHSLDITRITGSGHGGRVTKKDILAFLQATGESEPEPTASDESDEPGERIEPMSPMRREIASHMRRSLDTSAHVTTVFEIDMSKVAAIRARLKPAYLESHGVRLTYLAFIARATVFALHDWPRLNGEIRDDSIVTRSWGNLGVAVAVDDGKGLIVPVIKNAERLGLMEIARAIADLGERARSKQLVPDDVQGGTFTITNPGGFGAIMGTPIINQPQAAILDVEAIVKRPIAISSEDGSDAVAIRPMLNLCLSYDHRLVDGAYAAQFMRDLRSSLESWGEDRYGHRA